MISSPIFKRDSQGRIRSWQYEVEGGRWQSRAGLVGGTITASGWKHSVAASQDTDEAQALFEAKAEEQKKLDRRYRHDIADLDGNDMMFKPMLAKTYKKWSNVSGFAQPKLNGMRCIAKVDGLFSREGRPITMLPHVEAALASVFALEPDLVLDGELYNHDYRDTFKAIISACKKKNGVHPDAAKIQYHVYDCFDRPGSLFTDRQKVLDDVLPPFNDILVRVQTVQVHSEAELNAYEQRCVDDGYEGTMLRLNGAYDCDKRSANLWKIKRWQDAEFEIVDILSGDGPWFGYGKKIVVRLPDGTTNDGGIAGDQAFTKALLENREFWIGKQVTMKYFSITPDGKLLNPVAIEFHEGVKE